MNPARSKFWVMRLGHKLGPFLTRNEATSEFFKKYPNTDFVTTGFGNYGPGFEIEFTDNPTKAQS